MTMSRESPVEKNHIQNGFGREEFASLMYILYHYDTHHPSRDDTVPI
ncbi:UNVERIFIED_ORG: hypothetical protein J2Y77_002194 [Pseudomonas lini]